jgi:FO synthase
MARILLHGLIDNVQCSWVKLGVDGCRDVLAGGVNDLGGTLMEETISRMAGSQHGSAKTVEQLEQIVAVLPGRHAVQRGTLYEPVSDERRHAARTFTGTLPSLVAAVND